MKRLTLSLALGVGALFLGAGLSPAEAGDRHGRRVVRVADSCRVVPRPTHRGGVRIVVGGHRHDAVCRCRPTRVPGHYRVVQETVQDPGSYEMVFIPPQYRTVQIGCEVRRVLVSAGRYERVYRAGATRLVSRKVWVPAEFTVRHACGRRVS